MKIGMKKKLIIYNKTKGKCWYCGEILQLDNYLSKKQIEYLKYYNVDISNLPIHKNIKFYGEIYES